MRSSCCLMVILLPSAFDLIGRLEGMDLQAMHERHAATMATTAADKAFSRALDGLSSELMETFNAFDADGNGKLSREEVGAAVREGIMSVSDANVMKLLEHNLDGSITASAFHSGLKYMAALNAIDKETGGSIDTDTFFSMAESGSSLQRFAKPLASEVAKLFGQSDLTRGSLQLKHGKPHSRHPRAALLEEQAQEHKAFRHAAYSQLHAYLRPKLLSFVELRSTESPKPSAESADDTSTVANENQPATAEELAEEEKEGEQAAQKLIDQANIEKEMDGPSESFDSHRPEGVAFLEVFGKPKFFKPKPPKDYPKSKYGIPSFYSERCVLCQFLLQKCRSRVFQTVMSNDIRPSVESGNTVGTAIQQIQTMAGIRNSPGGKGAVRVGVQDCVIDFCKPENIPMAYQLHCEAFEERTTSFSNLMYFGYPAQSICSDVGVCHRFTYAGSSTSVHMPLKSSWYNRGRGKCGFMGGNYDRTSMFLFLVHFVALVGLPVHGLAFSFFFS